MKKVRSNQAAILLLNWLKHSFSLWVSLTVTNKVTIPEIKRVQYDSIDYQLQVITAKKKRFPLLI